MDLCVRERGPDCLIGFLSSPCLGCWKLGAFVNLFINARFVLVFGLACFVHSRSNGLSMFTVGLKHGMTIMKVARNEPKWVGSEYYSKNGIRFLESYVRNRYIARSSLAGAGSLAASQAMSLGAKFLVGQVVAGTNQEQKKAAYEIHLLTKLSNFNRSCLVVVDAISSLLIEARQHAAGVLFYLPSVEDYRRTIGKILGAISRSSGFTRRWTRSQQEECISHNFDAAYVP